MARFLGCLLFVTYVMTITLAADELYDVLGVPRSASSRQIKQAYKQLAREWYDLFVVAYIKAGHIILIFSRAVSGKVEFIGIIKYYR